MIKKDLTTEINKEKEKLNILLEKREALNKKIKTCITNIEKYRIMQNNEQYEAMQRATKQLDISMQDILSALQSGDLLGLQERMEAAKAKEETSMDEKTIHTTMA